MYIYIYINIYVYIYIHIIIRVSLNPKTLSRRRWQRGRGSERSCPKRVAARGDACHEQALYRSYSKLRTRTAPRVVLCS